MSSGLRLGADTRISEVTALTGLRGVAALYVVIFHLHFPSIFPTMPSRLRAFLDHGYLAVDLFFVLSGFVMALNYSRMFSKGAQPKYRVFLFRRFARIYPLYLFTLLLAAYTEHKHHALYAGDFISSILLVENWGPWQSVNGPAWSISSECFAYVAFPLVCALIFRGRRTMWIWCAICLVVLAVLASINTHDVERLYLNQYASPESLIRCVAEFSLGMTAYRASFTRFGQIVKNSAWVTSTLCALILLLMTFQPMDLVIVLLVPFMVISLAGRRSSITAFLGSPVLEYLGLLSYSIYLLHSLIIPFLITPLQKIFKHTGTTAFLYAAAFAILALIACSVVTYHFLEVPGRDSLRRLLEGPSGNRVATPPVQP